VLVTTRGFAERTRVGDPVSQAKIYEAQLADELIVLNITPKSEASARPNLQLLEQLATETFMPVAFGGGVRRLEDFGKLLDSGADKVSINAAALATPELITSAARQFGAQCVVVSVDCCSVAGDGPPVVRENGLRSSRTVLSWAQEAVERGAGELLLTDTDRDGTGVGLNVELGAAVKSVVSVPVILSGGCGRAEHFTEAFVRGAVDAVAAGTFFALRDQNPMQARAHAANAGVPVRRDT
jgi:cyclase